MSPDRVGCLASALCCLSVKGHVTSRHKNAFENLENVDLNGWKKTDCQGRVRYEFKTFFCPFKQIRKYCLKLKSTYFVCNELKILLVFKLQSDYAAASFSPVSFKLPESGKMSWAFVHFYVQWNRNGSGKFVTSVWTWQWWGINLLCTDRRASPILSHYDNDDSQSEEYDFQKSQKFPKRESSPLDSMLAPAR